MRGKKTIISLITAALVATSGITVIKAGDNELNGIPERLKQLETNVVNFILGTNQSITELKDSESKLNFKVSELETKLSEANEKISKMENQIDNFNKKLDAVLSTSGTPKDINSKLALLQAEADISTIQITSYIDSDSIRRDDVDYQFKSENLDRNAIGKWQTIAYTNSIYDFDPNKVNSDFKPYLIGVELKDDFTAEGQFNSGSGTWKPQRKWVNGIILEFPGEKTASRYAIASIEGNQYMFLEWKSGQYANKLSGKIGYYVLKKQ